MGKGATAEISEKQTGKRTESHLQGVHHEISQQLNNGNLKPADKDMGHQVIQLFGNLVIDGLHNAETGAAKATEQVTGGRITAKQALNTEKSTENFFHNAGDVAGAALKGAGNELAKETKPVIEWAGKHPAEALLIGAAVTAGAFALPEVVAGTSIARVLAGVAVGARNVTMGLTAIESSKATMELGKNHGIDILMHQQDKRYSHKQIEEARHNVEEALGKPVMGVAAIGLENGLASAAQRAERFTEAKELSAKLGELKTAGKFGHDVANGLNAAEGVAAGVVAAAVKSSDFQVFMDSAVAKFPALETFFKPVDSFHKVNEIGIVSDDHKRNAQDKSHH